MIQKKGYEFDEEIAKAPLTVAKFHSPNCPVCIEMNDDWKKLLKQPEIIELNVNLNLKFINVHADAIKQIKSKCAKKVVGVPTIMIVGSDGGSKRNTFRRQ